jgi:hypothetical protein
MESPPPADDSKIPPVQKELTFCKALSSPHCKGFSVPSGAVRISISLLGDNRGPQRRLVPGARSHSSSAWARGPFGSGCSTWHGKGSGLEGLTMFGKKARAWRFSSILNRAGRSMMSCSVSPSSFFRMSRFQSRQRWVGQEGVHRYGTNLPPIYRVRLRAWHPQEMPSPQLAPHDLSCALHRAQGSDNNGNKAEEVPPAEPLLSWTHARCSSHSISLPFRLPLR